MNEPKRVLVAPLDWGLGHAARCIPVINEFLHLGADVILAADGRPYDLLRKEFPGLPIFRYPGYSIQYSAQSNMIAAILKQLPAFLLGIRNEHKFLSDFIEKQKIDIVVSDSRYGVYYRSVPSIFIIHQLRIILPYSLRWFENFLLLLNKHRIKKFAECWIPDYDSEPNLSGRLSHSLTPPKNTYYVGALSRMNPVPERKKDFDILAIVSGPEPQRTIFEEILISQIKTTSLRAFIVRGMPERSVRIKLTDSITAVSSLHSSELSNLVSSSHIVISRPGYSTIMDLSFIGAKAIFVPTPHQTEQEYLAADLKKKMICYSEDQSIFNLERSLSESKRYSGFHAAQNSMDILQKRINYFLHDHTTGQQ